MDNAGDWLYIVFLDKLQGSAVCSVPRQEKTSETDIGATGQGNRHKRR